MADVIDIKNIKTIGDVISVLQDFHRNKQALTNDPDFINLCRSIFASLNIPFDPTDIVGAVNTLKDLGEEIPEATELSKILVEEVNSPEHEVDLGSKSLNKADLEVLLDEFDKHREIKEAEEIAREVAKNKLLKQIDRKDILEAIKKKIEIEARLAEKGVTPEKVDRMSDRILETRLTVEAVVGNDQIETEAAYKLAEDIIEAAEQAQNTDQAERLAKETIPGSIKGDANEVLQYLVETERATREIDASLDKIVTKAVDEIKKGVPLTAAEENQVLELVRKNVEEVVRNPLHKVDEAQYKLVQKLGGGVEAVMSQPPLSVAIKGVVAVSRPIPEAEGKRIEGAVKEAANEATNLWKADNNSAGKRVGEAMSSLTQRGAGATQIKQLMALRMAATKPGISGLEGAATQEYYAEVGLQQKNFPENKIQDSVGQADVVKAMLKSPVKISDTLKFIEKSKGILTGNPEMKPLLDVAETLKKNKGLTASMEMVQKLVHFQDQLDKLTGGILNKVSGGAFSQVGKIMGIEGMEQFGASLLNKMGLEAMSSHIAAFGLEGGLKSMLMQIFKTGTVTAVKAGATVAAGEAAAAGAMAATAEVASGPVGWVILAATLLLGVVKNLAGKMFNTARDVIGGVLESLGIWSADGIQKAKDALGTAFKWGAGTIGALATGILAIPGLIASAPVMAAVAPVMVIVLAALIGYNAFQTASTQASSLVSPNSDQAPGVCIPVSDIDGTPTPGGKLANCNPNAPPSTFPGIDKTAFVNVASRWSSGGGTNAARCYNDVVCRALSAGINPAYALWAWLHESGASNYSIAGVADFGIVYVPRQNFTKQIEAFLKLDPGAHCLGQPGIGSDYWLGFATNFLTGTCDPEKDAGGINGHDYKAEMESTWSMVSSLPMPATIQVGSNGGKCGNGTEPGVPSPDGQYICYGGSQTLPGVPGGSVYVPGATGLPGQNEVTDCNPPPAVNPSSKVVLTKQCGQAWSNKSLPGGSGTICSAGCGPTSASMILRHGNASLTPDSVIFQPGSAYGHMDGAGSSLGQAKQELERYLGAGTVTYDSTTRSCDVKAIGKWICAGKVVMILANFNGIGGHIFLGTSVQNGKIVSSDPYYTTRNPFNGTGYGYVEGGKPRECLVVDAAKIK